MVQLTTLMALWLPTAMGIAPVADPGTYQQIATLLQQRTSLSVRGGDYPIPETKKNTAKFISYAQIAIIGIVMAIQETMLPAMVRENKWTALIMVWFIGNAISSAITNSGAFEIFLGDKLIYSTLQTGHLPTYAELSAAFAKHGITLDER